AEAAVLVLAAAQEDLVATDAGLLGEPAALLRQAVTHGLGRGQLVARRGGDGGDGGLRLGLRCLLLLVARAQGLTRLATVAVERDGLETELPALVVDPLHVLDGRLVGQVDRLADR